MFGCFLLWYIYGSVVLFILCKKVLPAYFMSSFCSVSSAGLFEFFLDFGCLSCCWLLFEFFGVELYMLDLILQFKLCNLSIVLIVTFLELYEWDLDIFSYKFMYFKYLLIYLFKYVNKNYPILFFIFFKNKTFVTVVRGCKPI